jgi:hypothetical protein
MSNNGRTKPQHFFSSIGPLVLDIVVIALVDKGRGANKRSEGGMSESSEINNSLKQLPVGHVNQGKNKMSHLNLCTH